MRLKHRRSGNGYVLALLAIAVIGLGIWNWQLQSKLNATETKVDDTRAKGMALRAWASQTDGAGPDFTTGGLTSYLINLSNHLQDHERKLIAPGGAHQPGPPDNHLDPPPPPPWL